MQIEDSLPKQSALHCSMLFVRWLLQPNVRCLKRYIYHRTSMHAYWQAIRPSKAISRFPVHSPVGTARRICRRSFPNPSGRSALTISSARISPGFTDVPSRTIGIPFRVIMRTIVPVQSETRSVPVSEFGYISSFISVLLSVLLSILASSFSLI